MKRWQDWLKEIMPHLPHLKEDRWALLAKIANPKSSIKGLLPEKVSQDEKIQEPYDKKFTLCFDHFNESKCDFASVNGAKAIAVMKKLKLIAETTLNNVENLSIKGSIKRNGRNKTYNYLFSGISLDVDKIHELPFCDDGRIFCFWNETANFYIVAINTKHINLHYE